MAILNEVWRLNQKYRQNDYNGLLGRGDNYRVLIGNRPILISAPHAVKQVRNGRTKRQDGMTGGMAEYLCRRFGCFGVIRTGNAGDDPNYGADATSVAYREQVAELVREYNIRWVLDLHGIRERWEIDLDLGINDGRNIACGKGLVAEMAELWPDDLVVKIDQPYSAAYELTVSNYVHRLTGANCIQMEVGARLRWTKVGFGEFCVGMERLMLELDEGVC